MESSDFLCGMSDSKHNTISSLPPMKLHNCPLKGPFSDDDIRERFSEDEVHYDWERRYKWCEVIGSIRTEARLAVANRPHLRIN